MLTFDIAGPSFIKKGRTTILQVEQDWGQVTFPVFKKISN